MGLFWYPELNCKYDFEGKPDKSMLLASYIRYYLARLQSMFKYENLPDSIPQKWLENYLLVNGSCVFIECDKGLIVTKTGIGGSPDEYYIPTECIVTNPYIDEKYNRTYTRDVDCVLMVNDTYAQGILPLLKKYCSMMVENDITMNMADIMSRATMLLSAIDDNTKGNAELFIKRLIEGNLSIIGETTQMLGNQDKDLTVNNLSGASSTLTDLIEYHQYLKAGLYNELGLNSNYNMKREAINSNESQLNDDMLHPLIDTMLTCRREALEKVNDMFGTNITVDFDSAWEMNEIEEEAAVEQIEAAAEPEEAPVEEVTEEVTETPEEDQEEVTEEVTEEAPEVELTEEVIEEIAEAVVEKIEESEVDTDVEEDQ